MSRYMIIYLHTCYIHIISRYPRHLFHLFHLTSRWRGSSLQVMGLSNGGDGIQLGILLGH